MSDETEQRVCDEDFGSEEEGDVESYLEDNSGDLMDRLRELEVSITRLLRAPPETGSGMKVVSCSFRRKTPRCCWPMRVREKLTSDVWTR